MYIRSRGKQPRASVRDKKASVRGRVASPSDDDHDGDTQRNKKPYTMAEILPKMKKSIQGLNERELIEKDDFKVASAKEIKEQLETLDEMPKHPADQEMQLSPEDQKWQLFALNGPFTLTPISNLICLKAKFSSDDSSEKPFLFKNYPVCFLYEHEGFLEFYKGAIMEIFEATKRAEETGGAPVFHPKGYPIAYGCSPKSFGCVPADKKCTEPEKAWVSSKNTCVSDLEAFKDNVSVQFWLRRIEKSGESVCPVPYTHAFFCLPNSLRCLLRRDDVSDWIGEPFDLYKATITMDNFTQTEWKASNRYGHSLYGIKLTKIKLPLSVRGSFEETWGKLLPGHRYLVRVGVFHWIAIDRHADLIFDPSCLTPFALPFFSADDKEARVHFESFLQLDLQWFGMNTKIFLVSRPGPLSLRD